jgi:deoxycytidine triphosphate deaminase
VILSGPEIARVVAGTREYMAARGEGTPPFPDSGIDIDPFDPVRVGPNSYDLTLGPKVVTYILPRHVPGNFGVMADEDWLDARLNNPTKEEVMGPGGGLFRPGTVHLCSTAERTACAGYVPSIETRSSLARLGVSCHLSAGWGDDGFDGHWTLEITVTHPIRLYPGMRVCQVAFSPLRGDRLPYRGKYQGQSGPVASRAHEDRS